MKRNLLDFFVDTTNYLVVKALIRYWCLWDKFKTNLCEATAWGVRWLLKKFQTVLNGDQLVFNYILWCLLISLHHSFHQISTASYLLLLTDQDRLLQRLQQLVFVCFLSLGNCPVSPLWCDRKRAYLLPSKPNILPFDEQKENFAMCYVTKHFTWVSVDSDQWDHVLWTDVWSKTYLYLFVYFISEH